MQEGRPEAQTSLVRDGGGLNYSSSSGWEGGLDTGLGGLVWISD